MVRSSESSGPTVEEDCPRGTYRFTPSYTTQLFDSQTQREGSRSTGSATSGEEGLDPTEVPKRQRQEKDVYYKVLGSSLRSYMSS